MLRMVGLVFRILFALLHRGIWIVILALPLILRLLWLVFRLVSASILAMGVGPVTATSRMATDLQKRAIASGFPTEWERALSVPTSVFSWMIFISGWLIVILVIAGFIRIL